MSHSRLIAIVGIGLLGATLPVYAHHSFSAQFDANKPLKMTGTVTKVEWQNPHSWFYLDVKGDDGKIVGRFTSSTASGRARFLLLLLARDLVRTSKLA